MVNDTVRMSAVKREELHMKDVRGRVYRGLAEGVRGGSRPLIHDRLFYSEIVYGTVLRNRVKFDLIETEYINKVLEALNPPVIFCMPPLDVIKTNVSNSEDHIPGVFENIVKIYTMYDEIAKASPGILRYDYTEGSKANVFDRIAKYLDRRRHREW
jgi:thymidylate kinase